MTAGVHAADLEAALRAALSPLVLEVTDDSHLHAGHAGAASGRHFSVLIVAAAFADRSRVARHRLVYDAAAALMQRGIHALAIQAFSPNEQAPNALAPTTTSASAPTADAAEPGPGHHGGTER